MVERLLRMQDLQGSILCISNLVDFMAQWIRRWSTEPEILGSIPSGVVFFFKKKFPLFHSSFVPYHVPHHKVQHKRRINVRAQLQISRVKGKGLR